MKAILIVSLLVGHALITKWFVDQIPRETIHKIQIKLTLPPVEWIEPLGEEGPAI